jgi:hypothetical protein
MNQIMTFLLFFSPEKMIYSHHLMFAWGQALSWGQALPSGNIPFLPFALRAFIWIRTDPRLFLPFGFITFIWVRTDPENSQGKS